MGSFQCCQKPIIEPLFTQDELYDYCINHTVDYNQYNDDQYQNIIKIKPDTINKVRNVIGNNPFISRPTSYSCAGLVNKISQRYPYEKVFGGTRNIRHLEVKNDGYFYGYNNKFFIHKNAVPSDMINNIYELSKGKHFWCDLGLLALDDKYIVYMNEWIDVMPQ